MTRDFDIIVVGGVHAGVEAAWAGANLGARVALVTLDTSKIGVMSCNPAIGGLAKGQMVREVDAMGGLMGRVTDEAGIMFKVLNTSKGPAVRGPRAQCDKHAYARTVQRYIGSREEIAVIGGAAGRFVFDGDRIAGVTIERTQDPTLEGATLRAGAIVLTTGTFMCGLMHTGESKKEGGRHGEKPAITISDTLRDLGFELGRLRTGTPPRLLRGSIDWAGLEPQFGDDRPRRFSDATDPARFPAMEQVDCRITNTTHEAHELIRANLHRAPMYAGDIAPGPRYCPSIEDKAVRFADRESHHVFLEPESHESDWIYCNGIATSLPADIQDEIVRRMPGCAHAQIAMHGYAVEYDMVRPHQIDATCEAKRHRGLFLAGQINGTSGYEEAAGQGLLAGVNAVRRARGDEPVILGRDEAYIGVMMDDLVTRTPVEPYRMFSSRAEHRLLLRADNASDRLTPRAREWGVIDDEAWSRYERRRAAIARTHSVVDSAAVGGKPLRDAIRTQGFGVEQLHAHADEPTDVLETVLADRRYEGYIRRQRAEVKRQRDSERRPIPDGIAFGAIEGMRLEARQALARFRPATIGQASRLEGVNPSDVTLLMVAIERTRAATRAQAASASG
ncbi:MAG: tRNA uridine-5-carboxymethylaminomethyl(34) synthesis enzyme MnmG [Planctomycetota bacterium]